MARIRALLSSAFPCYCSPMRNFSSSSPVLAFFRRKPQQEEVPDHSDSTRPQLQADVARSGFLGQYEKAALASLIAKGLGKTVSPYDPPQNLNEQFGKIFFEIFGQKLTAEIASAPFPNRLSKFKFLTACEAAFSHVVPSPSLHQMTSIDTVADFYQTPVAGVDGLTQFQRRTDLPPNLHVSYHPVRFDPENDPYYGGITAFPGTANYVTGLKARKLYKGHRADVDWPKAMDTYRVPRHNFNHPYRSDTVYQPKRW